MASGYEKFTNEGCDVEGGHNNVPPEYENNIVVPSAPPAYSLQDKTSQDPAQQSSQYHVQHEPGTYVYLPQVAQPAAQQNVVQLTNEITSKPYDYFGLALCVSLLCCLPFGIFALVKSCEVTNRLEDGDSHGAAISFKEAKRWSLRGLVFGVAWLVVAAIIGAIYFFVVVGVQ